MTRHAGCCGECQGSPGKTDTERAWEGVGRADDDGRLSGSRNRAIRHDAMERADAPLALAGCSVGDKLSERGRGPSSISRTRGYKAWHGCG